MRIAKKKIEGNPIEYGVYKCFDEHGLLKFKFNDSDDSPVESNKNKKITFDTKETGTFIEDNVFVCVFLDDNQFIIDFYYLY